MARSQLLEFFADCIIGMSVFERLSLGSRADPAGPWGAADSAEIRHAHTKRNKTDAADAEAI